jgi:hypothetical protein
MATRSATELPEVLATAPAAACINRKSQTLRKWASTGSGPIQPVRIHGRLHWKVSDLRALLDGGAK